jgi:hypothetical protein
MRWHVHGTDAVTGQDVELALDEQEATRAVKAAIERRIVVDRITSARGNASWRIAAGCMIVAFAGSSAALLAQNLTMRRNLAQALDEQTQLAQSVARAEQTVKEIRDHGSLAASAATQVGKLAEELANSRGMISVTEQQLSAARHQASTLEEKATRVPELERQLLALHERLGDSQRQLEQSRRLAEQLRTQTVLQGRRLDQLEQMKPSDEAAAKIALLDAANKDLAGQIENLKSELLTAVARSSVQEAAPVVAEPLPVLAAPTTNWALGVSFEAARNFLALHADRDSISTVPAAGGLLNMQGMQSANAVRVQFVHDKAKERIYSGTLTVSLAADAPKDKLEENRKAVGDFLGAFAPGIKSQDLLAATAPLGTQDESRRLLFLGTDVRVMLWNSKGVFNFRVESSRGDAE